MYELWKERKRKKLKKQESPLKNLMFEIASWNRSQKKKQLNLFDVLCESKKNERTENGKGKKCFGWKKSFFHDGNNTLWQKYHPFLWNSATEHTPRQIIDELINWNYFDI